MARGLRGALSTISSGGARTGQGNIAGVTVSPLRAAAENARRQATRPGPKRGAIGNPRGAAKQVANTFEEMADLRGQFGAALTGQIQKSYMAAKQEAGEGVLVAKSQGQQYQTGKNTLKGVLSIFKSGEQAQAAAFAVAKAQQVQEQTNASDSQTAAFAQQLMMAKLQHQWAVQDWKRQNGLVQGANGGDPAISSVINQGTDISVGVGDYVRSIATEPGFEDMTAKDMAEGYFGTSIYSPDSPEGQVITRMFVGIKQGKNAGEAFGDTMNSLYSGLPGWDKWGDKALSQAQQGIQIATSQAFEQSREDAGYEWRDDVKNPVDGSMGAWVLEGTDQVIGTGSPTAAGRTTAAGRPIVRTGGYFPQ
jgi:hypothetical protein